ncbi:hypothetical protein ARMSODRAFT_978871 [Armillaria solidipes]|uniref:Uncharacterized protein n=1 Tax=Armillaria solidipes TaxID=1076256 RepID=A0A2H3BC61_9AGAR|nr:hypothetical protein ARMSODRAFT_978871 [Armillaria solidipes]
MKKCVSLVQQGTQNAQSSSAASANQPHHRSSRLADAENGFSPLFASLYLLLPSIILGRTKNFESPLSMRNMENLRGSCSTQVTEAAANYTLPTMCVLTALTKKQNPRNEVYPARLKGSANVAQDGFEAQPDKGIYHRPKSQCRERWKYEHDYLHPKSLGDREDGDSLIPEGTISATCQVMEEKLRENAPESSRTTKILREALILVAFHIPPMSACLHLHALAARYHRAGG